MTEAGSVPACPACGAPGVPSDPHDPVVEDFPWTCPRCGCVFVADDIDDDLLVEPDATLLATISDGQGKAYPVFAAGDAQWFDLTVRDEQEVAASASVSWLSSSALVLAQLSVAPPYRRCGLAASFIAELIELACRKRLTTIRGFVVDTELQDNPELLNWYARSGFEVVLAPPAGHVAAAVSRQVAPEDCRPTMRTRAQPSR